MDGALDLYNRGKFEECIYLLEKLMESDESLEENLIRKNCLNICQSLLVTSTQDSEKLVEFQDIFYLFYQNTTSLANQNDGILLQLELVAFYNFLWWILHYSNNNNFDEAEIEQYLIIINSGLLRISGKEHIPRSNTNIILEIMENMKSIIDNTYKVSSITANLTLEIINLSMLYILKLNTEFQVSEHFSRITDQCLMKIKALQINDEILENSNYLVKFGLKKLNCNMGEPEQITDFLILIKAATLISIGKFKDSLNILQKNSEIQEKNLWCYLGALNSFYLENHDQSLGFLLNETRPNVGRLKSRYLILQGRLHSKNEEHKEALNFFRRAKELSPDIMAAYYYLGEEYGKIGLSDMLASSFENMIKVFEDRGKDRSVNFTDIILDLIHPEDEISESEALYALACSYGLDERFQESAKIFEKLTRLNNTFEIQNNPNRIIQTPDNLTILHEAAVMNLLTGDLIRSEQICDEAFEKYIPKNPAEPKKTSIHIKDVKWLQNLINEELKLTEILNEPETDDLTIYYEENVRFFDEDVIGLLILAEIQRIQENEDYKTTLTKIYSIMSMHLSKMQRRTDLKEEEKHDLTLVKALTAKICLNVAKIQMETKTHAEVDRTFKRALSSNQGDKDVLYHYAKFFLDGKKSNEANKLWKSFFKKETTVSPEQCQSLALRYLLSTNVSKRELEKMENDIELATLGDLNFL